VLKALVSRWLGIEAAPKQKERREVYCTPEQVEEIVQEGLKAFEFEMNEWHEKFSTLHARLSKRVKREAQGQTNGAAERAAETEPLPSVLNYRRPWSV